MVSLGKIKLGVMQKRNHLNWSHDCETTASFGVVQPTICKMVIPKSKISIQSKTYTRLAPLPCPTIGRIRVNQSNRFVPISDVFEAYDFFQKQQQLDTAITSYIPQEMDNIDMRKVRTMLCSMLYPDTEWLNNCETISDYINRMPFRISFWLPRWAIDSSYYHELFVSPTINHGEDFMKKATEMVNLMNDSCWFPSSSDVGGLGSIGDFANRWIASSISSYLANNVYTWQDLLLVSGSVSVDYLNYSNRVLSSSVLPSFFALCSSGHVYGSQPLDVPFPWTGAYFASGNRKEVEMFHQANAYEQSLMPPMSLENADFILPLSVENYTLRGPNDTWDSSTFPYQPKAYVSFHLTPFGKRLIGKVFHPLKTYLFAKPDDSLELPKFFALYKSYFDRYNPGRLKTWKNTHCYRLIHQYYDNGITLNSQIENNFNSDESRYIHWFMDLLYDLGNMYATFPVDNITCATYDVVNDQPASGINSDISLNAGNGEITSANTGTSGSSYGSISDSIEKYGGLAIKFLERVYPLVNKNSMIGARIREYMLAHNLGLSPSERNKVSDDSFYVKIGDIFGTVNNDQTTLGEFAGQGEGGKQSKRYVFENDELGYFIQLVDVMPFGGYVQGAEKPHINRYDIFQQEFDSLGKEPLTVAEVMGRNFISNKVYVNGNSIYGFVPRYFQDKIINNCSAGDFSLRSTKSQLLPYTLNRLFDDGVVFKNAVVPSFDLDYELPFTSQDEELRYVGKYESFGNFDRIFYDTFGLTDNFIIHIINDMHCYAPCKPVSESFDTYDPDLHDSSIDVQPV